MLINLRNALMAGKRLPYDAEVEYLQSSGTQWIDIDASKVATASRYVCAGKYMVNSNQAMMWSHGYRGIRSYDAYISFVTGKYATTNTTVRYDTECIIEFDAASLKGILTSLGGTELANVTIGSSSASGGLRIFAASETATGYLASQSRLYFMRVYDAEGNILLDLIPVRRGTVGYLYDRVTRKLFGNAGTGDFVLGPDVVPVEYIESHGTEYIDTGVIPVHHEAKIKFSTPTIPLSGYMCGSFTADNRYYPVAFLNRNITIFNAVNTIVAKYGNDGNPHTIVYNSNGGSCYFDDVAAGVLAQTSLTTNNPIYLFGTSTSTGPSGRVAGRLYETELKDNSIDSLVRKFRPIRVGTEGAMMDVLTRRIYRNAGTGAFAYGNDLKYPIPAA